MAQTFFDSTLTDAQIQSALNAINGVIAASNNGKVLVIENGLIAAKSVTEINGGTIAAKTITANGVYNAGDDGADGYSPVTVAVPGAPTLGTKEITSNGTYDASDDSLDGYSSVTVNVSGVEIPNDNLACNWDFSNVANTRGSSSYSTGDTAIFTVDGWKLWRGAINIVSGGIQLRQNYSAGTSGVFQQWPDSAFVQALLNKTVTISMLTDGNLVSSSFEITSSTGTQGKAQYDVDESSYLQFYIYRDSSTAMTFNILWKCGDLTTYSPTIEAVKLEIGSEQTLATQVNGVWVLNESQNQDNEYVRVRAMVQN